MPSNRDNVDGLLGEGLRLYRPELWYGRELTAMTPTQPATGAKEAVIAAAERGAQLAGGDQRYVAAVYTALKTIGVELACQLEAGESASVCAPVEVAHSGRYDPGMVLLLEKRAVIAWIEGKFRLRVRSLVFAYSDIDKVNTIARDRGRLSLYQAGISFFADGAEQVFVLPSKVAKSGLSFTIRRLLSGAVAFGQESDAG